MGNKMRLGLCLIGLLYIQYTVARTPVQSSTLNTNLLKDLEEHKSNLEDIINQMYSRRQVPFNTKRTIKKKLFSFFEKIQTKLQDCKKTRKLPEVSPMNVTTSRPPSISDPIEKQCGSGQNLQGICVKSAQCGSNDVINVVVIRSGLTDSNGCSTDEVCCKQKKDSNDSIQPVATTQCGSRGECVPKGTCSLSLKYTHRNCEDGEECCPHKNDEHPILTGVNSCAPNRVCVDPSLCSLISDRNILLDMPASNCTSPEVCCRREDEMNCGQVKQSDAKFPWTVTILKNHELVAVGTLISSQIVVTTADAVSESDASKFLVQHVEDDSFQSRSVISKLIHNDFNKLLLPFNNIALLKLSEPFSPNRYLRPICLIEDISKIDTQNCILSFKSKKPQKITSNQDCHDVLKETGVTDFGNLVRDSTFCTESSEDVNGCTSTGRGNPLICPIKRTRNQYALIGLASCDSWELDRSNPELPGIYANVAYFYNWINFNKQLF